MKKKVFYEKEGRTRRKRTLNILFLRWFHQVLGNENVRAFVRAQMRRLELPVIQLTEEEGTDPHRT